jgi:hypothetical protein
MPRIIVTVDGAPAQDAPVFLEESVESIHLSTDHAARQLIERLSWALTDAEELERCGSTGDRKTPRASVARRNAAGAQAVAA